MTVRMFVSEKGALLMPAAVKRARAVLERYGKNGRLEAEDEKNVIMALGFLSAIFEDITLSSLAAVVDELQKAEVKTEVKEPTDDEIETLLSGHDCTSCPITEDCPVKPMIEEAVALRELRKADKVH